MIDFPNAPADGQLFTAANGITYQWSASASLWKAVMVGASAGDFFAVHNATPNLPTALTQFTPNTVVTGNSLGWYSTSTGRFTPPAGRYNIFAGLTSNVSALSALDIVIRKNGVALANYAGHSSTSVNSSAQYGNLSTEIVVDANGSDYFDIAIASTASGATLNGIYFGAFPVGAQVAIPPSAVGAVATPVYFENATWQVISGPLNPFTTPDSIVPNTMGLQIFSQSFTALNAAHRIRVKCSGELFSPATAGDRATLALYIDGVTKRQATKWHEQNEDHLIGLDWEGVLAAGAHTYMIRVASQLNASNFYMNGSSSSRWGGGTEAWMLTIEELNAP